MEFLEDTTDWKMIKAKICQLTSKKRREERKKKERKKEKEKVEEI